jgi:GH24 family phage-related lysozyme (muramidase)
MAVAALACACSTGPTAAPSATAGLDAGTRAATLACFPAFAPGASEPESSLVGKSLNAAESLASASDQTTRIIAQNGTCQTITSDLVSRRADLWIVRGQVIKAVVEGSFGTTSSA